ncbi:MAG: hypothetical protein ACJ8MH_17020, partial [Povalibacter sp.]
THHSMSLLAEAVRDEGTITGDYAAAAKLLESVNSKWNWPPPMYRGFTPVYAHALVLAGETERGRKVASSLLAVFDAEDVGRPEHWFGRERSAALIVLGKPDQAIDELAGNQRLNHWVRWWYLSELDPLYKVLRPDPRFQLLAAQAKKHRSEQRARLEEMRSNNEILRRGG